MIYVPEYYGGLPTTSIIKGKNSSTHRSPCYGKRGLIGIKTTNQSMQVSRSRQHTK